MTATIRLAEQLIAQPSLTPHDAGCIALVRARLEPLGFVCELVESGPADFRVLNLWAKRPAFLHEKSTKNAVEPAQAAAKLIANFVAEAPLFVFAGHTDVVPTGDLSAWASPPFAPTHRTEGSVAKLFGRGASDMKTSIAAMVVAVEEFVAATPNAPLSLAFLLTSDEEGPSTDGTKIMCPWLTERGEKLAYCIVGEPTSVERTGDMIKNGRRGTMSGKLVVRGIQGHVAYPQLARNPVHELAPALAQLVGITWDAGNAYFPATTFQVSNIAAGTGAGNVIPGSCEVMFNFRFCTESTPEGLQSRVHAVLDAAGLDYQLHWTVGGLPFLTPVGSLVEAVRTAIKMETGIDTQLSTTGGTSDGRFLAQICPQTIEFGPPNASIHKINENVALADIEPLKNTYRRVLEILSAA